MLSALTNSLKVKGLREKIFFILAMIAVYRIGAHIPVPGVDPSRLSELFQQGGLLGFLDMFSGGALRRFTIFAMSINPYITASIIMQLLTVVIPRLEELSKQGQEGKKVIAQYTRYATVVLALIQGFGITLWIKNLGAIANPTYFTLFTIIITLTAGTAFLMWLGEQITDKGIGNGISIIIFASVISRAPSAVIGIVRKLQVGAISIFNVFFFLIIAVVIVAAIIYIQQGERKIPVQYSKRVVGRKVYGGQSTHIPLKVNQAGVIPVIFASSVLLFPATIAKILPYGWAQSLADALSPGSALYTALYALLIIFFTYFYTAIQFNPREVADNIKQNGGFVPGRRPGRPTAEYLDRILTRITLAGAIFLAAVAVLPNFVMSITGIEVRFGGTALLIVIGVALQTMKEIETQLLQRHYQGFME
ncbi:preprotein translocase subunit SecY [Acetohalobium arabaticum]|uniref:Protein translocase subunit SecY n=1 Tax=Acetohalobium arabaticum (strain ATCC 49924 / DSM 5501 / Z-7288) TaxID=574087 RepID=D9QTG8_ACEAZ|nr:preprotein translocase subunit SecY [Acetohalobium arabaticum]ADL11732.1 protein translocase subunit secY/sec61 alpha [Acetohalobium arabaticum DSM 5501]